MGHVDEAKADIVEASQSKAGQSSSDVLAVGASVGAEGFAELVFHLHVKGALFADYFCRKLVTAAKQHPYALDLIEKNKLFDEAAAKYAVSA